MHVRDVGREDCEKSGSVLVLGPERSTVKTLFHAVMHDPGTEQSLCNCVLLTHVTVAGFNVYNFQSLQSF